MIFISPNWIDDSRRWLPLPFILLYFISQWIFEKLFILPRCVLLLAVFMQLFGCLALTPSYMLPVHCIPLHTSTASWILCSLSCSVITRLWNMIQSAAGAPKLSKVHLILCLSCVAFGSAQHTLCFGFLSRCLIPRSDWFASLLTSSCRDAKLVSQGICAQSGE